MSADSFEPRMPEVDVWEDSAMEKTFESARRHTLPPSIVVVTPSHKNILTLGRPADDPYLAKKKRNSKYAQVLEQFASLSKPQNISAIAMTDVATGFEDAKHPNDDPYTGARAIPFIWDLIAIGSLGHHVLMFEGHPSVLKMGCRDADVLIVDGGMVPFLQWNWASVAYSVMQGERKILIFQRDGGVRQVTNVSPTSDEAENLLQTGIKKFGHQDYRGAIADLRQAIALDSNFAQAYSVWGNTCFAMRDCQSAIACFDQAIRLDPYFANAYGSRGLAYYELGDKQRALDDFTQSIEINPQFPHAYRSRGEVYLELDNIPQALVNFEKTIDLSLSSKSYRPQDSDDAHMLHRIQNHYRSGIAYRHTPVEPLVNQALDARRRGDLQQALNHLAKALQLEPDLGDLYYYRSGIYKPLERSQNAFNDLSHAIQLNPRVADFYYDRACMYFDIGDDACIDDFYQAIKLDPFLAKAYFNIGSVCASQGNKQDGLAYMQQAATLFQQQGDRQSYEYVVEKVRQVNNLS
jgi:tetratricopeptide (TPR) repeat protein